MTKEEIRKIWEGGNKEEIEKLREYLQWHPGDTRVICRSESALAIYLKHHTPEKGFSFHPVRYNWDGEVWVLEMVDKEE